MATFRTTSLLQILASLIALSFVGCGTSDRRGFDSGVQGNPDGGSPPSVDAGMSGPICQETCEFSGDGECDDGASGSITSACAYGTDCMDCGSRPAMMPPTGMDAGVDECPCNRTLLQCDEGCECDIICTIPDLGERCDCDETYCAGDGSCRPRDACFNGICARRCRTGECPSGTTCSDYGPLIKVCE